MSSIVILGVSSLSLSNSSLSSCLLSASLTRMSPTRLCPQAPTAARSAWRVCLMQVQVVVVFLVSVPFVTSHQVFQHLYCTAHLRCIFPRGILGDFFMNPCAVALVTGAHSIVLSSLCVHSFFVSSVSHQSMRWSVCTIARYRDHVP